MYLRESAFQTVLFYKTRILRKADFSSQFRTKSASQSTRRPLILATVNKPWRLFVEQQSKDYQLKSSDLKARKPASRPQVSDFATNRDPDLNCIVFCVHQLTLVSHQLYQKHSDKCLELTKSLKLVMANCDAGAEGQKWSLEKFKPERLKSFLKTE